MTNDVFEMPEKYRATPHQMEETYEFFVDIDEKARMAAAEIDSITRAETAMFGNLNRLTKE